MAYTMKGIAPLFKNDKSKIGAVTEDYKTRTIPHFTFDREASHTNSPLGSSFKMKGSPLKAYNISSELIRGAGQMALSKVRAEDFGQFMRPALAGFMVGNEAIAAGMQDTKDKAHEAGMSMMSVMGSDIRLKENISKVSDSKSGIPIYTFNYKGDDKLWSGTMAQDLLAMGKENAVHKDKETGYYKVDYSKIDVEMKLLN